MGRGGDACFLRPPLWYGEGMGGGRRRRRLFVAQYRPPRGVDGSRATKANCLYGRRDGHNESAGPATTLAGGNWPRDGKTTRRSGPAREATTRDFRRRTYTLDLRRRADSKRGNALPPVEPRVTGRTEYTTRVCIAFSDK